jgi:Tol biopolymer transport system component
MNLKSIFKFVMIVLLALSFVSIGNAYGFIVQFKAVYCEHVSYDNKYFSLGEITYIMGGVNLDQPIISNPTVSWDSITLELPLQNYLYGAAQYQTPFGYVPPTSFSDWENITYTFEIDGSEVGSVFIQPGTLRELSIPVATYDDNTKTVSWQSVEFADEYRVRILQSTNVDDFLFSSIRLEPDVSQFSFDPLYNYILENGAIIAVEARDFNPPFDFLSNTSIYVTRSASSCECDFEPTKSDGDVDGSDLAIYAEGGTGINLVVFAVNFGRTDCPIQLTTDPEHDGAPAWSPNNLKIAFVSKRSGSRSIWVMNTDGSNKIQLTDNLGDDTKPHWSADSAKLVFHSNRSGNWDIWMMDSDGSNLMQLTDDPADDIKPDFSPDGSTIIFESNRSGNKDIWMMDSDGADPTQITDAPENERHPHFSHDGSKIVYRSDVSGNYDIWTMDSDGSNAVQLTNTSENEGHPHFSPDASKIVFWSERTGNSEVWMMNADGSEQTQLTYNPADDGGANWSPDGNKLVFRSDRAGNNDIWIYYLW